MMEHLIICDQVKIKVRPLEEVLRYGMVKIHTLGIVPIREPLPQKHSGMARVLKESDSFTCTPTHSSAIGMSNTCLCVCSYNWYSFTDPRGMEG